MIHTVKGFGIINKTEIDQLIANLFLKDRGPTVRECGGEGQSGMKKGEVGECGQAPWIDHRAWGSSLKGISVRIV